MAINIKNFLISKDRKSKIGDFQDLDHIDGVALSVVSADLYKDTRDDLVLFYFREGANYASVYTQSKITSENIKWNLSLKGNTIKALLVNTRNANAFTGKMGFKGIIQISEELSKQLTIKMANDEEDKNLVKPGEILSLYIEKIRGRGTLWKFSGVAKVDDNVVSECIFSAMIVDAGK